MSRAQNLSAALLLLLIGARVRLRARRRAPVPPGVYLVRLTQGVNARVVRAAVLE